MTPEPQLSSMHPAPADLTECDREPIRSPGAIQPHGVLLVVHPTSWTVLQFAGDTQRLLGRDPTALLGVPLASILSAATLREVQALVQAPPPLPVIGSAATLADGTGCDLVQHLGEAGLLLELCPLLPDMDAPRPGALVLVQAMVARTASASGLRATCQVAVEEIRRVTGFDRVMAYRFLPDGSGAVIAEARDPDLTAYLGLHYPASDIPAQARALYRETWLRLIPDALYVPTRLSPALSPLTGAPPDLGLCSLRAVSPLHLEYLANMGVRASMSVSIMRDGQLWGLLACHHRQPRHLSLALRSACEVFAQMFSLQLASQEAAEDSDYGARMHRVHESLVHIMARESDLAEGLIKQRPNLLDFIDATGVALVLEGRYAAIGQTPDEIAVRGLAAWAGNVAETAAKAQAAAKRPISAKAGASAVGPVTNGLGEGVVTFDRLAESYPPAAAFAEVASGALVLALSREPRDYIIWFRPDQRQTVTWAGNPNKSVEAHAGGTRLTPRRSFAAWQEAVRGRARPWKPIEVEAARTLRISLLETVVRRLDEAARERAKARERQDFLMAELDHRVKNTLANIQALVRHSSGSVDSVDAFVRELEQRLQAMAKAHTLLASSRWEGASLRVLAEEELRPHHGTGLDGTDRVTVRGPDLRLKPKAALALSLALHELATNAAKYGALSLPEGRLSVGWRLAKTEVLLDWVESGGPPVSLPTRRGFGSTMLERGLAYELQGRVRLEYLPAGLRCQIVVPLRQVVDRATLTPEAQTITEAASPGLHGRSILVVEDAALVALELETALTGAGAMVLGPAASLDVALDLAVVNPLDAALLDIDIDGELVYPVADLLAARGVPFAFSTGYLGDALLPPRFGAVPILAKPFRGEDAVPLVRQLLAAEAPAAG